MKKGGFSHDPHYEGLTNDWITPKEIIDAFGIGFFDLDPCASMTQPWPCALQSFTVKEDGLVRDWHGNIFLNPPYGHQSSAWIKKISKYGRGIALVFGRTDTLLWQDDIFPTASGYLFVRGRIKFHRPDGSIDPAGNAGAPSVLIAWGSENRDKLRELCQSGKINGSFLDRAFNRVLEIGAANE